MSGRAKGFLAAEFSPRWIRSYDGLSQEQKKGTDRVILALIKRETTPGMRIKPVEPEKYYYEARINDADRLIHRTEDGVVRFIEVVGHDDIGRYSRRIPGLP